MIRCIPQGLCSWEFDLTSPHDNARVLVDAFVESGTVTCAGKRLSINKQGLLSGRWTLGSPSSPLLTAQKTSPFSWSTQITGDLGRLTLNAETPLGRTTVAKGKGYSFTIAPVHPFTRRSTITGKWDRFETVAFTFWITALMWRRQQHS